MLLRIKKLKFYANFIQLNQKKFENFSFNDI